MIVDNLHAHHGNPVKAWLAEHAKAIDVFCLLGYSLELNPDMMTNADIKQAVTKQALACRSCNWSRQLLVIVLRAMRTRSDSQAFRAWRRSLCGLIQAG